MRRRNGRQRGLGIAITQTQGQSQPFTVINPPPTNSYYQAPQVVQLPTYQSNAVQIGNQVVGQPYVPPTNISLPVPASTISTGMSVMPQPVILPYISQGNQGGSIPSPTIIYPMPGENPFESPPLVKPPEPQPVVRGVPVTIDPVPDSITTISVKDFEPPEPQPRDTLTDSAVKTFSPAKMTVSAPVATPIQTMTAPESNKMLPLVAAGMVLFYFMRGK